MKTAQATSLLELHIVIGGDINIGNKVEKAVQDAMSASEDSAFSKASNILGGSENALERENRLLREQLAQKDAQIKQLMDLLAKK